MMRLHQDIFLFCTSTAFHIHTHTHPPTHPPTHPHPHRGEAQFTGGKDGSAALWPGVGACPPLVINSDHCVLFFHSDGSVVDWGWRCWVAPDFGDGDGLETMALAEVGARAFTLHQCLCDGFKPQATPADVASFQPAGHSTLTAAAFAAVDGDEDGQDEETLASLCGALSLVDDGASVAEQEREDAAVLALAKAQSRAKVVGRRFVISRRDAVSVAVRAAPDASAPMLGILAVHDHAVVALEERGEWMRIEWWRSGGGGGSAGGQSSLPASPPSAWVQRRRDDLIFLVPCEEDDSGGAQDVLLFLPNDELEDDDGGVQQRRGNLMYECAEAVLLGSAGPAIIDSGSASGGGAAGVAGENMHPADCLYAQQGRLLSAVTELHLHAARGFAKQSVALRLLQWPDAEPFDLALAFGGPRPFLRFLAVAFADERRQTAAMAGGGAGAAAAGGSDGGNSLSAAGGDDSPLLQILRRKIRQVLLVGGGEGNEAGEGVVLARTLLAFALRQLREAAGLYASVTPTRGLVTAIETPHPYPDNANFSWTVSFPGASRIKLVWDPRSSTEPNCDYVVLYRDTNHSDDNRVSPTHYSGRANDLEASWPGVGGRPPVYVEADHVDVVFRADASNTDWGCKVCFGLCSFLLLLFGGGGGRLGRNKAASLTSSFLSRTTDLRVRSLQRAVGRGARRLPRQEEGPAVPPGAGLLAAGRPGRRALLPARGPGPLRAGHAGGRHGVRRPGGAPRAGVDGAFGLQPAQPPPAAGATAAPFVPARSIRAAATAGGAAEPDAFAVCSGGRG